MINKELLKKQIIYRSTHRGTKEMDLLLTNFVKKHIDSLNINELEQMLIFLSTDDQSLIDYYMNKKTIEKLKKNTILDLFINFKLENQLK